MSKKELEGIDVDKMDHVAGGWRGRGGRWGWNDGWDGGPAGPSGGGCGCGGNKNGTSTDLLLPLLFASMSNNGTRRR